MKLGELITLLWQHSHGSPIHEGLVYELRDGKTIGLNDLRAIWQYLNQDIECIDTTLTDGFADDEGR